MFRHPDGALPERVQTLTVLGYAIAQGDLDKVKAIMKTEQHWLLNDADYSGNTPIVSLRNNGVLICDPPSLFDLLIGMCYFILSC